MSFLSKLSTEAARLNNESGGEFFENFVKFPEGPGSLTLRFLPAINADDLPYQATRLHRIGSKNYHCPRTLEGRWFVGPCPVCEKLKTLWPLAQTKTGEEKARLEALYRSLKANEKYYWNVIVRKQMNADGTVITNAGPKICPLGKKLHKQVVNSMLDNKELGFEAIGDVTDFRVGRDFKLVKTFQGQGINKYANYDSSHFMQPSEAATSADWAKWMDNLHDLSALRIVKPYAEIKAALDEFLAGGAQIHPDMLDADDEDEQAAATVNRHGSRSLVEKDFLEGLRS